MTDLTTRRAIERPEPEPPPDLPEADALLPVDPPSVFPDGVELSRLLARVQLTLAQAVELAAAVASELVRRSGADGGPPGREAVAPVLVGADGRVVHASTGPQAVSAADGSAGEALLAGIADAARPRARSVGPAAEELLAGLDGAVATLPSAGVAAGARMLREVAGAIDRKTVRAEIAALVRAIVADVDPAGGTPAPNPTPARVATAGRTGTGRRRTARRRIGAWLLSVLVLGGVVLLEVGLLRGHIVRDIGLLLDAGRGGSAASASAAHTPDGRPVAAPGPASAGPVAGVDLRALSPCAPGAPCSVRLEVRLTPGPAQQVVAWSYRVVDRCTGASSTAPGGAVTLPAGAQRATAVGTVSLPAVPGVALIAVTDHPAAAASAPLTAGSCTSHR